MSLFKYQNETWNDPFMGLDSMLGQLLGEGRISPFLHGLDDIRSSASFRLDTFADDNAYYIVAELPGVKKKDIDISLHNAVLTISGKRTQVDDEDMEFSRTITVGEDVSLGKVEAKLENGLLTVTLPKAEERKPRAISIA